MKRWPFVLVDVFTARRFAGNPLAVLPDAAGLTGAQMQQIAREFNFSESAFVLPPTAGAGADFRVRIFTPTREVGFAGHPNIGTAFVLAADGAFGAIDESCDVVFEEQAGHVPIRIERRGESRFRCELQAPQPLSLGAPLAVEDVADVLSLDVDDIKIGQHLPRSASVGLAFTMVELGSRAALARASVDPAALAAATALGMNADVHCYVREAGGAEIFARMFAPHDGVPEDPATGSANCALAALLASCSEAVDADQQWTIHQGIEMGRPSLLEARTRKRAGEVEAVWIAGEAVRFATGELAV